jgi:hypothetical protein
MSAPLIGPIRGVHGVVGAESANSTRLLVDPCPRFRGYAASAAAVPRSITAITAAALHSSQIECARLSLRGSGSGRSRGRPRAAQSLRQRQWGIHMLDLKSFHIVLIAASIVLMSGFGMWGLLNDYQLLGAISIAIAVLLVGYFAYFAAGARRVLR